MNDDAIHRTLADKRAMHPELREPLTWDGVKQIASREGIILMQRPLERPARLFWYEGAWIVMVDKNRPRRYAYHAAHELAHLWLHVDRAAPDRWERVYNMDGCGDDDPREAEAEYLATLMLSGTQQDVYPLVTAVRWPALLLVLVVASFLSAACGSSSDPKRGPTITFSQADYADVIASDNHLSLLQFQPSKIIVHRGADPLPETVTIGTQPVGGCGTGNPAATFSSGVDQLTNVNPGSDSVVFTRSYSMCPPYSTGVYPLTATYVSNGSTVTAHATVTVTERAP